jgi:hypothetical protein
MPGGSAPYPSGKLMTALCSLGPGLQWLGPFSYAVGLQPSPRKFGGNLGGNSAPGEQSDCRLQPPP